MVTEDYKYVRCSIDCNLSASDWNNFGPLNNLHLLFLPSILQMNKGKEIDKENGDEIYAWDSTKLEDVQVKLNSMVLQSFNEMRL